MTKSPTTFAVNERVIHGLFGPGTITEIAKNHTIIDFDQNGRRRFMTSMVQLERTTIPAPERPARKSRAKAAKPKKEVRPEAE